MPARGWVLVPSLAVLAAGPTSVGPASERVSGVVFYDENGNGRLDTAERGRIPGVRVLIGSRSGVSLKGGGVSILDLPPGTYPVSLDPETLPPFFSSEAQSPVALPHEGVLKLGVTLPIGGNRPNTYLAFGDSITEGEGSSDHRGYLGRLEARLRAHFGAGILINEGSAGTTSDRGVRRVARALEQSTPAYTLVLYGTNDWDESGDPHEEARDTAENIRKILRKVKAAHSLPFLATLLPVNVGFAAEATAGRDSWVVEVNGLLRSVARAEGAVLVDLHAPFARAGPSTLLADHVHPNDRGYERIAETFFEAIAHAPTPEAAGDGAAANP